MYASLSLIGLPLLLGIYFIEIGLCDNDEEAKLRFYHGSFEIFTEFPLSNAQQIFNVEWYNSSRPTVIFTHGFTGYPEGPAVTAVIKTYLKQNESNVALLNWDQLAAGTHPGLINAYLNRGVPNAIKLGPTFARTLQDLSATGLDLNNILLIGHSLGAHVFGIAGNTLGNQGILLPWIIGLDPAAAAFQGKPPPLRLHAGSAAHVEVIHSDPSKYGFSKAAGTVDFWPNYKNGQVRQPGCDRNGHMFSPEDICNHNRSWELLVDSLNHPGTILGINAKNYRAWKNEKDTNNAVIREIGKRPENVSVLRSPSGFVKGLGRMFYLVDPKETAFEELEDVPNFYVQAWPYFLMFMVLEHIVLKLEGKQGIRLNDGITSLSNGIFLEGGRFIWRGAESYLYTWVYANCRLADLPWDHVSTWILAAVGVDFCYYWMHRACHEVHILWAQHQVHHTSEDFNMGVGIRQSVLQGWCGFIFYLPLALVIPPAQFVMHHQLSYLYMFWIHTEAIKTLGILEHVFNTPSHHRIHHGSNPYCIDVNYGGVLIIWDKLFGTFRPERPEDRIVYGLIYQQPSFNPLHLQTFYTRYVVRKFKDYNNWRDKLCAIFYRPSWKPEGGPRYKDLPEDPKIHLQVKYDVILPKWCSVYLLSHYSLVLYGFYLLYLNHTVLSPTSVLITLSYILGSLTIFGMILDASPKAPFLEMMRCLLLVVLARVTPYWGVAISPPLQAFYVISGLFWMIFVSKAVEMEAVKTVE